MSQYTETLQRAQANADRTNVRWVVYSWLGRWYCSRATHGPKNVSVMNVIPSHVAAEIMSDRFKVKS